MEHYLVFCGEQYYACGGGYDMILSTTDEELAKRKAESLIGQCAVFDKVWTGNGDEFEDESFTIEWAHVIKGSTGSILYKFGAIPHGRGGRLILSTHSHDK